MIPPSNTSTPTKHRSGEHKQCITIVCILIMPPEILLLGEIVQESRDAKAFFEHPKTQRAERFLKSFEY